MRTTITILLLALALPAAAQEQEIRNANLPRSLESELLALFRTADNRTNGETRIRRTQVIRGDLAAHEGPLYVAGRVTGDLAMVGGDVVLESGGSIEGSVTVIGGEVRMADDAEVGGTITAYGTSSGDSRWAERDRDRDRERDRDDDRWWDDDHRDWYWDRGYSRLTLRTGSSYNRVEGLPIMFGPIIQTSGPNPLRLEALAIWRTEAGASLETERMGYQAEVEQFLGGARRYSVGASLYSVINPMDQWQITDLEASLATAVFHDDYRDHFDRSGWSVFATATPAPYLEARVEYRAESHEAVAAGDPWSLFDGGDIWRAQPFIAEGDLRTVEAGLELDLRDDDDDPYRGFYARVALERPVSGELNRPPLTSLGDQNGTGVTVFPTPAIEFDTDFTTGFLDVRRYNPVGYRSQLNLRVVAAGNVAAEPLPAQFQHALGGIGTLPGFDVFHADCGARAGIGFSERGQFYPSYGCDRMLLGQAEYRGRLSLDFGFGDPDYDDYDWWDDIEVDLSPTWVVFFDAAQGWAYDAPGVSGDRDTGMLYDAGIGFLIEDVGLYAALPLNGDVAQEPRFFIRLGRRF